MMKNNLFRRIIKGIFSHYFLLILTALIITVSCEQEVYLGPPEEDPVQDGKISVKSNPTGAKIYLDGKNMGITTPDTLSWLKTGTYIITLKLGLFEDTSIVVNVTNNFVTNLNVDYYLNPGHFGSIECNSTPTSAKIYLNDEYTGRMTPFTFNGKFPGQYKITLTYSEYRDDSTVVTVRGGKTVNFSPILDDTSKWVNYNINNSALTSNHLSGIDVDNFNNKWIGTRDRGVARFNGKKWIIYNKDIAPLPFNLINCLAVDFKNNIWIGTTGGLVVYTGTNWINYTNNLPSNYITSIAFDKMGKTWIGTSEGLGRFDGLNWQIYNSSNSGLPGNYITCLTIDNQNRVWAGTMAYGIYMYDGTTWKVWNMSNMNLGQNYGNGIKAIAADKNSNIWVAHIQQANKGESGGLTLYEVNTWKKITVQGIPVSQIESIYIDENNFKWIGTTNGVAKFSQTNSPTILNTQNSKIPASQIFGVTIDKNGDLWVATFGGGLGKLKKGNF